MQSLPRRARLPRGAGQFADRGNGVARSDWDEVEQTLRALLVDVLGIDAARVAAFDEQTELFGALPEFDSMAVASLLTGIEERFGLLIEDDDVDAEDFASFGTLAGVRSAEGAGLAYSAAWSASNSSAAR